jgi:hypothetical protein
VSGSSCRAGTLAPSQANGLRGFPNISVSQSPSLLIGRSFRLFLPLAIMPTPNRARNTWNVAKPSAEFLVVGGSPQTNKHSPNPSNYTYSRSVMCSKPNKGQRRYRHLMLPKQTASQADGVANEKKNLEFVSFEDSIKSHCESRRRARHKHRTRAASGKAIHTSKRAWLNPSYSGTLNAFDVSDEQLDPEKKGKLAWSPAAHKDWRTASGQQWAKNEKWGKLADDCSPPCTLYSVEECEHAIRPSSPVAIISAASKPPHVTGRAPDTSKRAWLNPSYSGTLNAFDVSDEQLDPEKKGKLAWSPAAHEDWKPQLGLEWAKNEKWGKLADDCSPPCTLYSAEECEHAIRPSSPAAIIGR